MSKFDLISIGGKKDSLTGKPTVSISLLLRLFLFISIAVFCLSIILTGIDYSSSGWMNLFLFCAYCACFFAFWLIFIPEKFGKVCFQENKIAIQPSKKPEKFPDSPISFDSNSKITIHTIQQFKFPKKTILHMTLSDDSSVRQFGFVLKNRNEHLKYINLLDSWYKNGLSIDEYDRYGHRVFKLNEGKNYAEVQNIKEEYKLEW